MCVCVYRPEQDGGRQTSSLISCCADSFYRIQLHARKSNLDQRFHARLMLLLLAYLPLPLKLYKRLNKNKNTRTHTCFDSNKPILRY